MTEYEYRQLTPEERALYERQANKLGAETRRYGWIMREADLQLSEGCKIRYEDEIKHYTDRKRDAAQKLSSARIGLLDCESKLTKGVEVKK